MKKTKLSILLILAFFSLNSQAQNRDVLGQNSKKSFDILNGNDATNIPILVTQLRVTK